MTIFSGNVSEVKNIARRNIPFPRLLIALCMGIGVVYIKDSYIQSVVVINLIAILFALLFQKRISLTAICLGIGFFTSSPSLIGENNGLWGTSILFAMNLVLMSQTRAIIGAKRQDPKINRQKKIFVAASGSYIIGLVLLIPFSASALTLIIYSTNVVFAIYLISRNQKLGTELAQYITLGICGLNLLAAMVLISNKFIPQSIEIFRGEKWGRGIFTYGNHHFGIITGGGRSLLFDIPRFVGITGEPGLWALLSMITVGFIYLVFDGKSRIILVVSIILGLLLIESAAGFAIAYASVAVAVFFTKMEGFKPIAIISFTVLMAALSGKSLFANLISFKITSGESLSLRDRGFSAQGLALQNDVVVQNINYINLLFSKPIVGILLISSLIALIYSAYLTRNSLVAFSCISISLGALISQPIQYHVGFLFLELLIIALAVPKSLKI